MEPTTIKKLLGIAMLALGIFINYRINKSRFNRRNMAGVEMFRSYDSYWSTRLGERIGKLFAIVMILAGITLLVATLPK